MRKITFMLTLLVCLFTVGCNTSGHTHSFDSGVCSCGNFNVEEFADNKFTAIYLDYDGSLIKKTIFNDYDEFIETKGNYPTPSNNKGYTYVGWKKVYLVNNFDKEVGVKCTPEYVDSRDDLWDELEGNFYGQEWKTKDNLITFDKSKRTMTFNDASGMLGTENQKYVFNCIILGAGEGTSFPELTYNAGESDSIRIFMKEAPSSYGLCMTLNSDGTLFYRGYTFSPIKYTQELLNELIYAFPWPHGDADGNTYMGIADYCNGWTVYSSVAIYDCDTKMEYVDYLDQVKVDLKVYCEVKEMYDSNFACFFINACVDGDEIVIDQLFITQEAEKGDKFRVDLTFYFDSEDVDKTIFIVSDDYDLSD